MVIEMNVKKKDILKKICNYLPESLSSAVMNLENEMIDELCEIRIKSDKPVILVFSENICFITVTGRLTNFISNELLKTDGSEVKEIFNRMCRFSVYSHTESIANGFITLENGCRVGVYGTAVTDDAKIKSVRNIKGLNIRIAGYYIGISQQISQIYKSGPANTIICGAPSTGKTTMLKDLCCTLSDTMLYKMCVIDERAEFDSCYMGILTDVLTSYPKHTGIQIAVRTLSPDIVVCDELGTLKEASAVVEGLVCGVNFIMTIHASSMDELLKKEQFRLLMEKSVIDYCVFIGSKCSIEDIYSFRENGNENSRLDLYRSCLCDDRTVYNVQV